MSMRLKPVEEQVVALMGASSGIGRETALRFAERGAKVVVSARNEKGLNSLVEEIRGKGGQATAIPAEVTEFEQVKAVADRAVEVYGRLDTWVHLAAVLLVASFEDTTPEEFARVVDVNLMGQVYGTMAALPHIKREGGGALIHVSSMGAKRSIPLQSAYCASKHGIDGFLESLRVGAPAREAAYQRHPGDAGDDKHALLRQGAHQAGRQAGRSAADLPAGHRFRSHPPRRREPGSGSGRRGRGQGGNPQPGSLAAAAGHSTQGKGFPGPLHGRAQTRGRPGQSLRAHRRPQHHGGILPRPGASEEPLHLAGVASDGEAGGCGGHGDRGLGCLAKKDVEPTRGSLCRSEY